jgi:hypothetical protein
MGRSALEFGLYDCLRYREGLDGPGSIPVSGKIFLFSTASRPTLGPTQPLIQWATGALSPGIKRQGREPDHSPPSTAKVMNGGYIAPSLHMFSRHTGTILSSWLPEKLLILTLSSSVSIYLIVHRNFCVN